MRATGESIVIYRSGDIGCTGLSTLQPGRRRIVFHLISKLYERTSVMIITNLSFAEWPLVIGDELYRFSGGEGCTASTACLIADKPFTASAICETDAVVVTMSKRIFMRGLEQSDCFRDFV